MKPGDIVRLKYDLPYYGVDLQTKETVIIPRGAVGIVIESDPIKDQELIFSQERNIISASGVWVSVSADPDPNKD